jgi:hypothetical protein
MLPGFFSSVFFSFGSAPDLEDSGFFALGFDWAGGGSCFFVSGGFVCVNNSDEDVASTNASTNPTRQCKFKPNLPIWLRSQLRLKAFSDVLPANE